MKNKKKHVWLIECQFTCGVDKWTPVIRFSDNTPAVWLTRETARLAAKHMEKTNNVNHSRIVIQYRAVKYIRRKS